MLASKLKKICQNRNCLSWRKLNSLNSPEILSWPKATKPTYTSTLSDVPHVLYLMPSMMMCTCTLPDVIYNGLYMYSTWSHLWAPVHVLYLMPSMMTCTCTLHDVLHDVYMYSNWCFPCHVHVLYLMSPMMTCTCSTWWPPWCYVHLRYLMSQGCVHLLYLFHKISYWFLGWLWKGFCCIALWTAYQNNIVYSSYHPVHVLVPSADFACCSESQLQKVIAEVGAERKHITAVLQAVQTLILQ